MHTIIYMLCVGNNILCARLGATYLMHTYTVTDANSLALLVLLVPHYAVLHCWRAQLYNYHWCAACRRSCSLTALGVVTSIAVWHMPSSAHNWSTATLPLATIFTSMLEGMGAVSTLGYVLYMPAVTMTSLCGRVSRACATTRVYICYIFMYSYLSTY